MKRVLIVAILLACGISISGCRAKEDNYEYKMETPTEYREIETQTIEETVKNLKDFSTKQYVSVMEEEGKKRTRFVNEEKTIIYDENNDGNVKEITYKDLVGIINNNLTDIKYQGYEKKEALTFNYTETKNEGKSIYANFIDVKTVEEQAPDDYTKKVEKTINDLYTKEIVDITYLNKENLTYQKGIFKSREASKKEELKYEETDDQEEINKIHDPVYYSFGNIERFYEYKDKNNFEAQCKGTLDNVLSWTQIEEGINLLKDFQVTITQTQKVKGEDVEVQSKIKPLTEKLTKGEITENSFNYDMIVKDGDIIIEVDMTEAIKNYFKVFEEYRIVKAKYSIEIGHR